MKTETYIKRIDNMGRISLPSKLRKNAGIKSGDCYEFCTEGDTIILVQRSVEFKF